MSTTRTEDQFPLSKLPKEIREETYSCSPLSVLGLLARTSKQYEAETAFLRLLQASIHAYPMHTSFNAIAMLRIFFIIRR